MRNPHCSSASRHHDRWLVSIASSHNFMDFLWAAMIGGTSQLRSDTIILLLRSAQWKHSTVAECTAAKIGGHVTSRERIPFAEKWCSNKDVLVRRRRDTRQCTVVSPNERCQCQSGWRLIARLSMTLCGVAVEWSELVQNSTNLVRTCNYCR